MTSKYSYDNIYELTQAVVGGTVAESYTYDAVGNRLTSAGRSDLQLQHLERAHLHVRRHVHIRQQRQYDEQNRLHRDDLLHLGLREPPHQRDPAGNGWDRQLQVRPVWKKD